MTTTANKFLAISAAAVMAGGLLGSLAHAQSVYRIVGPDGKVTFSDKPPPAATDAKVVPAAGNSGGTGAALPFELRQVANKYPVTLYTGSNCAPCSTARSMLVGRGIPFTEKTVTSNDDVQALQRLSGENSLPFATIGGQQLKGYSDVEWTQFLDAAGYPKSSVLPPNYRPPAASPLVAATAAATPARAASAASSPAARPATPTLPAADNPAGIKF